jgi:hypothetical protein
MSRSPQGNYPDLSHSVADHPTFKAIFADAELRAESGQGAPSRLIGPGWRRRDRG